MKIESTVSGTVLQILVAPGDEVTVDQEVVIVESMKMEIPIVSETSGTVDAVLVADGDIVQESDELVALKTG